MIYSAVENWGHNAIADGLRDTRASRNGSYLAFAIFELGIELAYSNLAPLEYAARGVTHIVLSPFKKDFSVFTGMDYLLNAIYKTVAAVLLDNFIVLIAIFRLLTLNGHRTTPLFSGPNEVYNRKARGFAC